MLYKADMHFPIGVFARGARAVTSTPLKQHLYAVRLKNTFEHPQHRRFQMYNSTDPTRWSGSWQPLRSPKLHVTRSTVLTLNCCKWRLCVCRPVIRKEEDSGGRGWICLSVTHETGGRLDLCMSGWSHSKVLVLFVGTWATSFRVTKKFGFGTDDGSCFTRRGPWTCLREFQGSKSKYLGQIVSSQMVSSVKYRWFGSCGDLRSEVQRVESPSPQNHPVWR